jgi:nucleotide-binding universal stress UspA family protein
MQAILPHNISVVATLRALFVYKHILIATDGSELAGKAVAVGLELAKSLNARTTPVNVTEPWSVTVTGAPVLTYPTIDYEKAAAENTANVLSTVSDAANKAGVTCETLHVSGFPAESIVETAQAKGCLRPDRNGVARAAGSIQAIARDSNDRSAGAHHHAGACLPVSETAR